MFRLPSLVVYCAIRKMRANAEKLELSLHNENVNIYFVYVMSLRPAVCIFC